MSRTEVRTVLFLTTFLACNAEQSSPPDLAVAEWVVASEPDLSIGGEEDGADPLYRVGGAVRTSTGYWVSNRSADEVRFYDLSGRLVARIGRDGSGPREFRNPRIVGVLAEDSIVVFDSSNSRISIICSDYVICLEIPLRYRGQVVGVGQDHAVVIRDLFEPQFMLGEQQPGFHIIAFDRTTSDLDTLLVLDSQPRQIGDGPNNSILSMAIPLTRPPQVAVSANAVIVANGRDPILKVISFGGVEVKTIEVPIELHPLTNAEFRAAALTRVDPIIDQEPALADLVEAMEPPDHRAPIRRLLVDRTDHVWIERDQDDPDDHDWIVVDMDGTVRATATTPEGVDILDIGEDYVLGIAQDSLDIEYVNRYVLSRR